MLTCIFNKKSHISSNKSITVALCIVSFFLISKVFAHFGMIIPSNTFIDNNRDNKVNLKLSFSHPFEYKGMKMNKPEEFGVFFNGKRHNLTNTLTEKEIMGYRGWNCTYTIKRPAIYQFYMIPAPYWEPAEDLFIQHFTKVYVPAFGINEGWSDEIGLKTEIIPLTRPFGLYAGNTFQGMVKVDGKPSSDTVIEVVYYNIDNKVKTTNPYLEAQQVKTDINGVFTYSATATGWWGFAALTESSERKDYNGKYKNIELGAVAWIFFNKWN